MSEIDFDLSYDIPQTGSFTAAAQTLELDPLQKDTQAVSILGTWVGTIVFEASNDGTNYFSITGFNVSTGAPVDSTTVNGNFIIPAAGYSKTRLRASSWTSGTANLSNEGANGAQWLFTKTPDTSTIATALNALNAYVQVVMAGMSSVGFQIIAGTFIGTLTPQCSIDGGTTWANCGFYDPANSTVSNSVTFTIANTTKVYSILPIGGSSHVRVIATAFTSGTANAILRASQVSAAAGAVTAAAYGNISNSYLTIPNNTAQLLLSSNSNRKYAYISNNSSKTVNIQFGSSTGLSGTTGLVIQPSSFYEVKGDNLFTGNIYGYSAGGSASVSISEGTP